MFTGTISHSGALVTAVVVLTGAAILRGGAAIAETGQDDQFLALLDQEGIPALRGVPSLIETAHDVCRTLDAGMSATGLVDAMVNNAVGIDPGERDYTPGRLARTEARFITAAVGAYCPYNRGKIASLRTNPTGWEAPGRGVAADARGAVNLRGGLRATPMTVPAGEIDDPNPPQLPAPPPQAAQIQTPRVPVAAPSAPKRPPPPPEQVKPPPQQPPPPPQQMEPAAGGPQPGGAGGSGGGGGAGPNGGGSPGGGGGIPADPSPGFVRLAP
jgi:uncharacterized membrane protein YgcG